MSLDPDIITKSLLSINKALDHMNHMLQKTVSRMERASTKIVAAHSRTHGIMMGVVADLDLMTGAFGKIKSGLANLFLPLDKNAKGISKFISALTTLEGKYSHVLRPLWEKVVKRRAEKPERRKAKAVSAVQREFEKGTALIAAQRLKAALSPDAMAKAIGPTSKLSETLKTPQPPITPLPRPRGHTPTGQFVRTAIGGLPGPAQYSALQARMQDVRNKALRTQIGGGTSPVLDPRTAKPFTGTHDPVLRPTVREKLAKHGIAKDPAVKQMKKTWQFMKKPVKGFHKNVALPLKQIASGGLGLGFQATVVMGLMQAFSSLFTIFQPIMDVVGMLMERLSVGFMPIIMIIMDILTSEPVLAIIDLLSKVLAEVFSMFEPLVPIIIEIIQMALTPLMQIFEDIMPIIQIIADLFIVLLEAFMPIIDLLFDLLAPALTMITKIFLLLVVLGLYPLMGAIWGIGLFVAALIDLFTLGGAGAINAWNKMMGPIFSALNVATGAVLESFHTGTDFVPRTGVYGLQRGEVVLDPQESAAYRSGGYGGSTINLHVDGGVWVQDIDELADILGKKLAVHRY